MQRALPSRPPFDGARVGATRASRRLRSVFHRSSVSLAAVGVPLLINAAWVVTQRRGQPLDIDEAGYVEISFNDYLGLHTGGISGWWHHLVGQGVQAPLAPALGSLLDFVTGPHVLDDLLVSVLAYGGILSATIGLTREWSRLGRTMAFLFVAVAVAPVLLDYGRSFNFAELAAAWLAAALFFHHRSRGFTRTAPALAWGACLGLMLLSRTMTVAFLPGLVLAALVPVIARASRSGLLRVIGGLLVGTAVAATWYVDNFNSVYDYLTSAGYGSQASQYGAARNVFSPHDWYLFLVTMTDGYLYAAEAFFLALGWVACAAIIVRRGFVARTRSPTLRPGLRELARWLARDPAVVSCSIVAAAGMTALLSSRNQGSAFIAPLVVPLVIVAAWGTTAVLGAIGPWGRVTLADMIAVAVVGALGALAVFAGALTLLPMSSETTASVSFFGNQRLVVWDSRGTLRAYEDAGAVPASVEPNPGSAATGLAWLSASSFADDQIWHASAAAGRSPVAVFTFNSRLLNVNTVGLDSLQTRHVAIDLALMSPLAAGASPPAYFSQEAAIGPSVTAVATLSPGTDQFQPAVPPATGVAYAESLHFMPFARRRLPDGQWLVLWAAG